MKRIRAQLRLTDISLGHRIGFFAHEYKKQQIIEKPRDFKMSETVC